MVLMHWFSVMSLSLMSNPGKAQDSGLVAVPSLIWASSCAHRLKFSPSVFSSVFTQVYGTWGWQEWLHKCPLLPVAGIPRSHPTPSAGSIPHVKHPLRVALFVSTMDSFLCLVCEMTLCFSRQIIRLARCRWGTDFLMWKGPLFSPHSLLPSGWSVEGRDKVNIQKIMFLKHNNYD